MTKDEAKRQEILDAAGRVFAQYGLRKTTVGDVVSEAGFSPYVTPDVARTDVVHAMGFSPRGYSTVYEAFYPNGGPRGLKPAALLRLRPPVQADRFV